MRSTPAALSALPAPSSADFVALWRCDEAAAANNLTDALGARTLTQTGNPAVSPSLVNNNVTSGARDFDGSTQYALRAASDGDHTVVQGLAFGAACWINPDVLATRIFLELGAFNDGTANTNMPFSFFITGAGALNLQWQIGNHTNRSFSVANAGIVVGARQHVGVSFEPDIDNLGKMTARVYKNGACISINTNLDPPTGGSLSRWIVGASLTNGGAGPNPALFFNGKIDDVAVCRFTPDAAWFRMAYARGVRDFTPRGQMSSTHSRVLVQVTNQSQFSAVSRVDLEWIDLTDLAGYDFVKSITFGDTVEDFVSTAKISCVPRFEFFNLSPFVTSAGSLNDNPLSAGGVPLLKAMRRIRIETAMCPAGMEKTQAGPFYEVMFDGFIRAVDVTDDEVTVTAADLGIALLDVMIEPDATGADRQYGSSGGTAVQGELQAIIDDNDPARLEIVGIDDTGGGTGFGANTFSNLTVADVNGKGRPHPFNAGDTVVVSGTVNFNTPAGTVDTVVSTTALGIAVTRAVGAVAPETVGIITAPESFSYKGRKPTLYTPTSPAWNVFQWNEPASKGVLQALDDIMAQIGWRVRFKWHEARQCFRLTCFNPQQTFGEGQITPILSIDRMSLKVDDFRTPIIVEYTSESTKDPAGDRIVFVVSAIDKTNLRDYGRRMGRVRVASDSKVNASGEAQELADSMNKDLSQPTAEVEATTMYWPWVEVQDAVDFFNEVLEDGQMATMFGQDYVGACIGIEHRIERERKRTTVKTRNFFEGIGSLDQSVSRIERHGEMISQRGVVKGRGLSAPVTSAAPTVRNLGTLNGLRTVIVEWVFPAGDFNQAWVETEVHVSTTTGFTPSSSTLKHVVGGTTSAVSGLAASTTHYAKVVHRDKMGNRSAASAQTSFVTTA